MNIKRYFFFGLPFDDIDRIDLIDYILNNVDRPFEYVVTPNVDHVVRLYQRSDLKGAYYNAFFSVCDSNILRLLFKIKKYPCMELITGSDLTADILNMSHNIKLSITIIGGSDMAVEILRDLYPGCIFKHLNPSMGFINNPIEIEDAVSFVCSSASQLTLFCVGSPQQELLAKKVYESKSAKGVGLCVGASVDFITGQSSRAPVIFRRIGFEWLYRLATNPVKLWRRYLLMGPKIFIIAMRSSRDTALNFESRKIE